ncbi:MAG TPA: phage recombination protein Bet [Gemmatimonadaceae bacterium]|jgi:phage recombination protein Bet
MDATNKESRASAVASSVGKTALVLRERLTPELVELLKKTVAKGASDDEFALFVHQCERTGLDPFAKQIYCLKRRTKDEETQQWIDAMVTQVGIDGFRLVAQRTGEYRGQKAPVFYDPAGNGREVWLDPKKPPVACKVGVLREGFDEPLYAIAMYDEYVQKKRDGNPNKQWKEKPTVMLAKCAEALALRKAFPHELSGLYTDDEIHDDVDDEPRAPIAASATRPRLAGETMTARATEDGSVELTFGEHKGRTLAVIPTSYLIATFREPWKDSGRKETAAGRLGVGFIKAVESELERRKVPLDMMASIAKLIERQAGGEVLAGEDAEWLRQWNDDHPAPVESTNA